MKHCKSLGFYTDKWYQSICFRSGMRVQRPQHECSIADMAENGHLQQGNMQLDRLDIHGGVDNVDLLEGLRLNCARAGCFIGWRQFVKSVGKPRILLLMPDAGIHHLKLGSFKMSLREAPLTLSTLAALVPAELDAKLDLIDESVDKVPFDCDFDLVAISCLTGTAARAYETADRFRRAGATVVLGGVHVSLRPEEAAQHSDSIVTGFAERTWPMLLKDFMAGNLKSRYDSGNSDLAGMPVPRHLKP